MPKFSYECAVCGGEVSKSPVGSGGEKKGAKAGLGGWKCSGPCHGKGVKVVRKIL